MGKKKRGVGFYPLPLPSFYAAERSIKEVTVFLWFGQVERTTPDTSFAANETYLGRVVLLLCQTHVSCEAMGVEQEE